MRTRLRPSSPSSAPWTGSRTSTASNIFAVKSGPRSRPKCRRHASASLAAIPTAVFIVPLRIGGGTRLKIYEAMATARAVVSTTVGAEGLDVHHGRDIMLADDPRSFAQAVIMLLRDPDLRRRYQQAAVETAARHDWPAIGERFSEVLHSVAEKKSRALCAVPTRLAEKKA